MIMSSEGGVEIEEVAKHSPEKILQRAIRPRLRLAAVSSPQAIGLSIGTQRAAVTSAQSFLPKICQFFRATTIAAWPKSTRWSSPPKAS